MAYASASEVHKALADGLKITEGEMPPHYRAITNRAAAYARNEIKGRLLKRGFRSTGDYDLDNWDRNGEFSLDLALWKSIMWGGLYNSFDRTAIAAFDRREELDSVLIYINEVWIQPTGDEAGLAQTGERDNAEGLFGTFPDPDDVRRDEPIQW